MAKKKGVNLPIKIIIIIAAALLVLLMICSVLAFQKDFDGDGTPDFLDRDADNDGVPRSEEGMGDIDGDGMPNDLDYDADGDGLSDTDEYLYLETHHLMKYSGDVDNNKVTGMVAKNVRYEDGNATHDGTSADGDYVADVLESYGSGYYLNNESELYHLCINSGNVSCYQSNQYINDGPIVQDLIDLLNNEDYEEDSHIINFKTSWNGKERGYIDYVTWDYSIWYGEIHRFNHLSTDIYLFKHINPHDDKLSHWSQFLNFHTGIYGNKYQMTIDANGWIYAPHGDYSGNLGAVYHNPLYDMNLSYINWKTDPFAVTWKGSIRPQYIADSIFMSPSPIQTDGNPDFCRTVYTRDDHSKSGDGKIVECGKMQYESTIDMNYHNWMTSYYHILKDQKLKDILLPGTHDTAAFTLSHELMVDELKCYDYKVVKFCDELWRKIVQRYNIYEQLSQGVRLMDWRPVWRPDENRWFLYHNGIGSAISAPSSFGSPGNYGFEYAFNDNYALRQVRTFMDSVDDNHELVILYLQNPKGINTNILDNNFEKFMEEAEIQLGKYLYKSENGTANSLLDMTLADITADGSKVMFILDETQYTSVYNIPENGFWRVTIKSSYNGNDGNDQAKLQSNAKSYLSGSFSEHDFVNLNYVRTSGAKPNLAAQGDSVWKMAPDTNQDLSAGGWIEDNIPQSDLNKVNTYTVDYFTIKNTIEFGIRQNMIRNIPNATKQIAHLYHSNGGNGGFITYLTWNGDRWYAEFHRFTQADNSSFWLIKHTNEKGDKVHYDRFMNFKAWNGGNWQMKVDENAWSYAPDGDWSSPSVVAQPIGQGGKIRYWAWNSKNVESDWNGAFLP